MYIYVLTIHNIKAIWKAKANSSSNKMKAHKLQINILNVITIALSRRRSNTMLLIILLITLTLTTFTLAYTHTTPIATPTLLLTENFLTKNCNKLNENPNSSRSRSGRHSQFGGNEKTNCTQVTEINNNKNNNSKIIVANNNWSNNSSSRSNIGIATQQKTDAMGRLWYIIGQNEETFMPHRITDNNYNNINGNGPHSNALNATKWQNHMATVGERNHFRNAVDDGGNGNVGDEGYNSDDNIAARIKVTNRAKRFILFNGGGVVKLVLGISLPVLLADKQRSLNCAYNIQLQYTPPPRPIYWWSIFNSSAFAARQTWGEPQLSQKPNGKTSTKIVTRDASRGYIYAGIESIFERQGLPGTACLLKTICDVAFTPFHHENNANGNTGLTGILHAFLNAIFTPELHNVHEKYLNARQAGQFGADCAQMFKECPKYADNLLKYFIHK